MDNLKKEKSKMPHEEESKKEEERAQQTSKARRTLAKFSKQERRDLKKDLDDPDFNENIWDFIDNLPLTHYPNPESDTESLVSLNTWKRETKELLDEEDSDEEESFSVDGPSCKKEGEK
ncbi:PREDICTED: uncharacterized protein LOC109167903 [Ipomoea nil]|uniref:uncharacterized protein LOC109167903 n=1 Tax=Ipomoea nil TaxID=35883 RepID=UPI0009013A82|nr:PREDICTED: uncharacterized protein LOC109167903 [Ipomoea nil]